MKVRVRVSRFGGIRQSFPCIRGFTMGDPGQLFGERTGKGINATAASISKQAARRTSFLTMPKKGQR